MRMRRSTIISKPMRRETQVKAYWQAPPTKASSSATPATPNSTAMRSPLWSWSAGVSGSMPARSRKKTSTRLRSSGRVSSMPRRETPGKSTVFHSGRSSARGAAWTAASTAPRTTISASPRLRGAAWGLSSSQVCRNSPAKVRSG